MTKENWTYPNTKNWAEFKFEVDGIEFVSKLDKTANMFPQVLNIGEQAFINMNYGAVKALIGNTMKLTRTEIISKLERVNHGATQAVIELAGN